MTTIPTIRSIEHGLPYNAASTRSSLTMVTTITTLTILGKSNWNKTENYPMLWNSVHEFTSNLGKGVCVFGVWVLFLGIFLSIGVCVE